MSQPEPSTQNNQAESLPTASETLAKPKLKYDWQPLGTIRDSFYEQMKQDQRN